MLKNKNVKIFLSLSLLILMLSFNFMTNFLSTDTIGGLSFSYFQGDSENLVIAKMNYDKFEEKRGDCDYGLCMYDNNTRTFSGYRSQFGLQGYVFSFLINIVKKVQILRIFTSLALATVLVLICYFISKKYDKLLGIIFYGTFFFSPWVIAFARNLYWVPFTWFTPCLLGLLLSLYRKKKKIIIPLIYLSILIKCLCGYEYITTIMLSTIVFFIIDLFVERENKKRIVILKTIFVVGIVCLLGFGTALMIHGYKRGSGDIVEGIESIYKTDVLRRTIITTDKHNYTGIYRESMDASVADVIKLYVYNWNTDIVYGVDKKLFPVMIFITFIVCIINIIENYKYKKRDFVMFMIFLITTLSWLILGKSHSYIHTHMNYVLWYFGFIQVCFYIIIKFIFNNLHKIKVKGEI